MKRSKKYQEAMKKVDQNKFYSIDEATKSVKEVSYAKFEATINVNIKLALKDKQKKESVRGTIVFPNLVEEAPKVLVLADGADQETATKAGADYVGLEDLVKKIEEGFEDFSIVIATPDVMSKIAKLGKYIGRRGLMPNPKNGTVTKDLEKAIQSFKSGKTNFKMLEGGIFQFKVAKSSMTEAQIKENLVAFLKAVNSEVKKFGENIFKSISISPTMGPAIYLDLNSVKENLN